MKTKGYVIGLFLALCLAISLPAIHEVANPQALQGGKIGPAPAEESPYYLTNGGADCVLYHAYWDGTSDDHSPVGTNDGTVVGATFTTLGGVDCLYFTDDDKVTHPEINLGTNLSVYYWAYALAYGNVWGGKGDANTNYPIYLDAGSTYYTTDSYVDFSVILPLNEWMFISIRRVGTTVQLYKNCVQQGTDQTLGSNGAHSLGLIGMYFSGAFAYKGYFGQILYFNATQSTANQTAYYNATSARYASLDPQYRNHLYAQEKKHEKSSLYRVPRNATVSSAMRSTRGTPAHYRQPIFQDAPRQGSARAN